jgi:hypothetical protein
MLSNMFSVLGLGSTDDAEELSVIASASETNASQKPGLYSNSGLVGM